MITIDNSIDESAIGGNASAEDGAEDTEDVKETGEWRLRLLPSWRLRIHSRGRSIWAEWFG